MTYSSRGGKVFFGLFLTFARSRAIICGQAGVLELADEEDSKSFGLITRAGSTPATGTNKGATPAGGRALVDTDCSWSTRRIPRRLRRGIPSCRHPIRLPFSLIRAAAAGSGACAASNLATGTIKETQFVYQGILRFFAPFWRFSRFFGLFGLKNGLQSSNAAVPEPFFSVFRAKCWCTFFVSLLCKERQKYTGWKDLNHQTQKNNTNRTFFICAHYHTTFECREAVCPGAFRSAVLHSRRE